MERVQALLLEAQREHRHDDLLDRTRRPVAAEGHPAPVVLDRFLRIALPRDVRCVERRLGLDLDVGQAVVEEVLVGECRIDGLCAEDVEADPGRASDELLRELKGVDRHEPIAAASGVAVVAPAPAALSRISTTPVEPSTRIRSPVLIRFVAIDVPMTAGMPNSRERTAGCEVVPPVSVTSPPIFVNSTTHAGFVIWQTRMSPSRTWSNSSVVITTRAVPSTVPGEPAMPSIRVWSSDSWRWNRSGYPQFTRYGKASCDGVTVPTQSRGWTFFAASRSARRAATIPRASTASGLPISIRNSL